MATTREIERNWTKEQMESDSVSKKEIAAFLQEHGKKSFLKAHKLQGQLKNVTKTAKKDHLIDHMKNYLQLRLLKLKVKKRKMMYKQLPRQQRRKAEPPKYHMKVLKKGDKNNIPRKGDTVAVWYTGKLQDGTVFDSNVVTGRKAKSAQPLRFKVGLGKVIRGWDEALLTMSSGEKVELTIEPEWAYGRKGNPDGGIPPNATLIFEMELANMM
ncbi:peptidyl-prolyl cis-trans isomerase FKBP3-like [Amphiura filiformis]|uniref:peptidyl-prolyl cis-trans isomerase FKBP3-like n=1 Tax=Amphiura filiformis TaxID=82378 RepID=UPI003B20E4F1